MPKETKDTKKAAKKPAKKATDSKPFKIDSKDSKKAEPNGTPSMKGAMPDKEAPIFRMMGQYAKDVSFECPTPIFMANPQKQTYSLDVALESRRLEEKAAQAGGSEFHALTLRLKGTSKDEKDRTLHISEVEYVGVFEVRHVPPERLGPVLAIEGAALIFPFARQILTSCVLESGFRAPMIEPINFHGLYMQSQQQSQQQPQGAAQKAKA